MQVCTFAYIEVQILSNKGGTRDCAPLVMVGNTNGEIGSWCLSIVTDSQWTDETWKLTQIVLLCINL